MGHQSIYELGEMRLLKATEVVAESIKGTLTYHDFPEEHRRKIRTNDPLERERFDR